MSELLYYGVVGFIAQMIDGTLGMACGVSASTLLLSFGLPPVTVSATVHASEMFTTGLSGLSHHYFGNVDQRLFRRLLIPGMIGAAAGAYVLSNLPGDRFKPFVALYLLFMGGLIVVRVYKTSRRSVSRATSCRSPSPARSSTPSAAEGGDRWSPRRCRARQPRAHRGRLGQRRQVLRYVTADEPELTEASL